jgi:RES domain
MTVPGPASSVPPPDERSYRMPLDAAVFQTLPLVPKTFTPGAMVNLRWSKNATPGSNAFYASMRSRLTPISGAVPCVYLSFSEEVSFKELYSDLIHSALETGTLFPVRIGVLNSRVFVKFDVPEVRVCDLTDPKTVDGLGFDLGTLYATKFKFPQTWAQRIHDHPAHVDGILYESRPTKQHCLVIWPGRNKALDTITFTMTDNLMAHARVVPSGTTLPAHGRLALPAGIGELLGSVDPTKLPPESTITIFNQLAKAVLGGHDDP